MRTVRLLPRAERTTRCAGAVRATGDNDGRASITVGPIITESGGRSQHGMQAGVSNVSSVCSEPVGWPLLSLSALVLTMRMLFAMLARTE